MGNRKGEKNALPSSIRMVFISIISVLIVFVSWILNMGWYRFALTFSLVPLMQATVFILTNMFMASYIDKSKSIKLLNLLFCVTYLSIYILLPDTADYGEMYFFFGLIHSDPLAVIAQIVTEIAFLAHIVLFILQIIFVLKFKKSQKENMR